MFNKIKANYEDDLPFLNTFEIAINVVPLLSTI